MGAKELFRQAVSVSVEATSRPNQRETRSRTIILFVACETGSGRGGRRGAECRQMIKPWFESRGGQGSGDKIRTRNSQPDHPRQDGDDKKRRVEEAREKATFQGRSQASE